jgi:NAD(P)-dependent dehydrogenase (short-subunit alcohol dehydrogenase family)
MDRFSLEGKVAVVTGGSRGLGKEMCKAFAERGADVVIASRNLDNCRSLAGEIEATTSSKAMAVQFHAGKWSECDRLVDEVYENFGRVDVLVNNAGMAPLYPSLLEVTEELFDKTVAVNFKGPFRLSALIGERMAQHGGGSIINISSVGSLEPKPSHLVYGAAKAALNALTCGLARAYAPTVRCNAIVAGPFLTDISKAWDLEAFERDAKTTIPLQRGGRPEEIVGAALYFASGASSFTTGSLLKIDGGRVWGA